MVCFRPPRTTASWWPRRLPLLKPGGVLLSSSNTRPAGRPRSLSRASWRPSSRPDAGPSSNTTRRSRRTFPSTGPSRLTLKTLWTPRRMTSIGASTPAGQGVDWPAMMLRMRQVLALVLCGARRRAPSRRAGLRGGGFGRHTRRAGLARGGRHPGRRATTLQSPRTTLLSTRFFPRCAGSSRAMSVSWPVRPRRAGITSAGSTG